MVAFRLLGASSRELILCRMIFRPVTSWTPCPDHLSSPEQSIHPPVLQNAQSSPLLPAVVHCQFSTPRLLQSTRSSCPATLLTREVAGVVGTAKSDTTPLRGGEEGGTPLSWVAEAIYIYIYIYNFRTNGIYMQTKTANFNTLPRNSLLL